jgi:hypothetical protein
MNDYWNDPPEEPELPECPKDGCDGIADWFKDTDTGQMVRCEACGHKWEILFDVDPEVNDADLVVDYAPQVPAKCPHGAEWGCCDTCDHAADLAYDAAREKGR